MKTPPGTMIKHKDPPGASQITKKHDSCLQESRKPIANCSLWALLFSVFLDNNEQINEVIDACETIGVGSAEYFCEEFVFIPDGQEPEDVAKLHDPLYLDISEFNYLNWEGNQ